MIAQQQNANGHRAIDAYEDLIREQLHLLGHDTNLNGLIETPQRVARFHLEHFTHFDDPIAGAAAHLKPFDAPVHPSLVAVRCSFSAFCEHHLLPFFGTAQVIYLPQGKITGLSKISRVVNSLCMRVRGGKDACSSTRTRTVAGDFKTDADLRDQALAMLD